VHDHTSGLVGSKWPNQVGKSYAFVTAKIPPGDAGHPV
jgi:hypothetical protein